MTSPSLDHTVCPFCACLCDDLSLAVDAGRIIRAENACTLAQACYAAFPAAAQPAALVGGRAVTLDQALQLAAQVLLEARFPLVCGLTGVSCEAQREAVALAELLGASLDPAVSAIQRAAAHSLQQIGASSATLGEIKNRADLILYWGADPEATHPRHLTRYTALAQGRSFPSGQSGRTLVVLDHTLTATARAANLFLQTPAGRDFEVVWALRGLLRGLPNGAALAAEAGLPLETLEDLLQRLRLARYAAIFYGPRLAHGNAGPHAVAALLALVAELNAIAPCVAQELGGPGNAQGAENVLAWQTGYGLAVNFSRGYPRANPGEFSAGELLARGEADAALIIAAEPETGLPSEALQRLRQIPTIVIGPQAAAAAWANVAIVTASLGVDGGGTAFRADQVPLTLHPALSARHPAAEAVLTALHQRLRPLCAGRLAEWPARKAGLVGGQAG